MAAHGAVLVLTVGVVVASRLPLTGTAEAGLIQPGTPLEWANTMGEQAAMLMTQPVAGSEASEPTGLGGPSDGQGDTLPATGEDQDQAATEDVDLGFMSPGPIAEADPSLLPWEEPQSYTVEAGDTITGIASQFGIDAEALLYANPALRDNPYKLNPGDVLTILPVNGVLHIVAEGDTLQSIAEKYQVTADDITAYAPNHLDPETALAPGAQLVVPGGQMEVNIPSYYELVTGNSSGDGAGGNWAPSGPVGPVAGTGQFYIAAYGRVTQGYRRYHPGVDIANRTGTPIYAVDGGSVEAAGWLGWAGNAVVIDHGNGYKSLYAHMSSLNVARGQAVQRGQIIGGIGCTRGRGGRCTGPHLHLEMYYNGARVNPCSLGVCP